MKMIILIIGLAVLIYLPLVSAGLVGSLNVVEENSTFYFDMSTPNITINNPTGTETSKTGISLSTSIIDYSPLTCFYWITDSNLNPEVSAVEYDCSSASFSVSSDGDYIAFVNATDDLYSNESNSSFSVSTPVTGGGGGGGGSTLRIVGNETSILDFGTTFYTFTIFTTPSSKIKNLQIKNLGSELISGKLTVSSGLDEYLSVTACDKDLQNCGDNVNLESGETGYLVMTGTFDNTLGKGVDGFITVEDGTKHELKVRIDRPPLYGFYSAISKNIGVSEFTALIGVYLLFAFFIYGIVKTGLVAGA